MTSSSIGALDQRTGVLPTSSPVGHEAASQDARSDSDSLARVLLDQEAALRRGAPRQNAVVFIAESYYSPRAGATSTGVDAVASERKQVPTKLRTAPPPAEQMSANQNLGKDLRVCTGSAPPTDNGRQPSPAGDLRVKSGRPLPGERGSRCLPRSNPNEDVALPTQPSAGEPPSSPRFSPGGATSATTKTIPRDVDRR